MKLRRENMLQMKHQTAVMHLKVTRIQDAVVVVVSMPHLVFMEMENTNMVYLHPTADMTGKC